MTIDESNLSKAKEGLIYKIKEYQFVDDLLLDRVNFHRVDFTHQRLINIKFSYCSLRGAFLSNSVFRNCVFKNCSLITVLAGESKFIDCQFINSKMYHGWFESSCFDRCVFEKCNLYGADFSFAELNDCIFLDNIFEETQYYTVNGKEYSQCFKASFYNAKWNGELINDSFSPLR